MDISLRVHPPGTQLPPAAARPFPSPGSLSQRLRDVLIGTCVSGGPCDMGPPGDTRVCKESPRDRQSSSPESSEPEPPDEPESSEAPESSDPESPPLRLRPLPRPLPSSSLPPSSSPATGGATGATGVGVGATAAASSRRAAARRRLSAARRAARRCRSRARCCARSTGGARSSPEVIGSDVRPTSSVVSARTPSDTPPATIRPSSAIKPHVTAVRRLTGRFLTLTTRHSPT